MKVFVLKYIIPSLLNRWFYFHFMKKDAFKTNSDSKVSRVIIIAYTMDLLSLD